MPSVPPTMNAVAITTPGGPEVLKLTQLPTPRLATITPYVLGNTSRNFASP